MHVFQASEIINFEFGYKHVGVAFGLFVARELCLYLFQNKLKHGRSRSTRRARDQRNYTESFKQLAVPSRLKKPECGVYNDCSLPAKLTWLIVFGESRKFQQIRFTPNSDLIAERGMIFYHRDDALPAVDVHRELVSLVFWFDFLEREAFLQ